MSIPADHRSPEVFFDIEVDVLVAGNRDALAIVPSWRTGGKFWIESRDGTDRTPGKHSPVRYIGIAVGKPPSHMSIAANYYQR